MKKIFSVIVGTLLMVTGTMYISGCGCSDKAVNSDDRSVLVSSEEKEPSQDIVGNWKNGGEKEKVQFGNDGTYQIGNSQGRYSIDENNTLTLTPDSNGSTAPTEVFTYISETEIPSDNSGYWYINEDTVSIGGVQYSREKTEDEQNSSPTEKNQGSSSTEKDKSSSPTEKSQGSSSTEKDKSSSPTEKSHSSSPTEKTQSTSSKSEEKATSSSATKATEKLKPGEEEKMVTLYEEFEDEFEE